MMLGLPLLDWKKPGSSGVHSLSRYCRPAVGCHRCRSCSRQAAFWGQPIQCGIEVWEKGRRGQLCSSVVPRNVARPSLLPCRAMLLPSP